MPNGSFEAPRTDFADPRMDSWQKAPQPAWYQSEEFPWDQLAGQFANTEAGTPNHIANIHGSQAAFIFALPEVAIFQDRNSVGEANGETSEPLNAIFEAGKSYALTVGIRGGGGGMTNGATFEISLYYRDAASNQVTVAATTITNSTELFPANPPLIDFQARTPIVKPTDPWFGKQIGIRLASTAGFDRQGGYWDVDHVRVAENLLPNNSFELPRTEFADPRMDGWRKAPQPAWYQSEEFPWEQMVGQFLNTPPGASNHISNIDGEQAAFLFALPEVAIYQDESTFLEAGNQPPRYEPGKSYALTVGVRGGGGGMVEGATFEISLYYLDGSNQVTVASRTITNTAALFPANTPFADFQARTPIVQESDSWAGKAIGVRLASVVNFGSEGGYWDIDEVRLTESVIPNGSFESPDTDFADPRMDGWQKAPQPAWYQSEEFPWEQLAGQFLNTPPGSTNHIVNLVGEQAAFIFALPDMAIFQEFGSIPDNADDRDFSGRYELGKSYALTAGLRSGGGMPEGATVELAFYYRDAGSNAVTVAATTVTNSAALFPNNGMFSDFRVTVPLVSPDAAWTGRPIGIRLASTTDFERQGGYWDVDHVRLEIIQAPILVGASGSNPFEFTLESPHGRYEVLSSTDITVPASAWSTSGTITNTTGRAAFTDPNSSGGYRFYQVRQAP